MRGGTGPGTGPGRRCETRLSLAIHPVDLMMRLRRILCDVEESAATIGEVNALY